MPAPGRVGLPAGMLALPAGIVEVPVGVAELPAGIVELPAGMAEMPPQGQGAVVMVVQQEPDRRRPKIGHHDPGEAARKFLCDGLRRLVCFEDTDDRELRLFAPGGPRYSPKRQP